MERQSLELFFALSGSAVALLFFVVIWQQAQLTRAKKEITRVGKAFARKTSGREFILPLIETAPFPLCYADTEGIIQRASEPFHSLSGGSVGTLTAFAKATGAQLINSKKLTRHERVVIQGPKDSGLRHFALVTWPVKGTNQVIGTVYALLEQTSTVRHSAEQHHFNHEILALQEELVHSLQTEPDTAVLQELGELTHFLKDSYIPRPQRSLEQFDLVRVVHDALEEYRPHFRKQQIAVTSTLPKQLRTAGFATESLEVVRLLLAGVAEHAHPHSTVRLHVERRGVHSVLSVTLPEYKHTTGSLEEAFSFGKKADQRASKVRFALARVLMGHQHGSLHLMEDGDGLVVAELVFGIGV